MSDQTRTYVVKRIGRRAPTKARAGGRYLRRFPAVVDLTDAEAADLRARGFSLAESGRRPAAPPAAPAPAPPAAEGDADGLDGMTRAELFDEFDARGLERPHKDTKKAELVALLRG